ncbi:glycoside hydrolase family 10 protein [Acholeplasma laidlawii]|uniref:Family 10 glycosylhydrolase n=1 Tax=Acholeplasma laidlawii TaxID=2148 RepID=A0A553IJB1_ACHLA|nr:family 10 glycosylhydrolase [Acholeplasma laidlawii]NWH10551.1 family 10 glycosylhydrolase [Acholeplasma laidlawii]NWH11936.1 family 10 glycosylhydrolase [Acholeplasma laidlawii]NWH12655.1 family 10 glycosylhydrolase [Acholeplasma laidlawii]NWH13965.1 family 10 glycosylhydrolase [Acholeplasma laidlawii]OAN19899.1 hypothetical protein A2I99_03740 [Acholeplasma laidlawii]
MKLNYFGTDKPLNYFNTDKQVVIPEKFNLKPFRAFWISNVLNIDLPNMKDPSYKDKVIEMLDTAKAYNMTAIFFQVRTTNDAFYKSKLNPYSRFLTGKEGEVPLFDVLEFVIKEAKNRSLEVHAWCNPYRVSMKTDMTKSEYLSTLDDLNFAKRHPEFVITDKNGQLILNPAKEEVKTFIIDSMLEIADNYDVDGIHFDDYFYPYAGLSDSDNDASDFEQRTDKSLTLGDFRRNQITDVIRNLNKALKEKHPNLRFGVSPFGIWKTKKSDELVSNVDPQCSQSYDNQYADSYLWIKEGIIDYIVPQLYWDFEHKLAPFADLALWWAEVCKGSNVDLYIGHGPYRYGEKGGYENPYEVVNQLKFANQFDNVVGNVFFTYKTFIDETKQQQGMHLVKKLLNGSEDV